jgi:MFS family permease
MTISHAARRLLLPAEVDGAAAHLLLGRALRAFADGYVAVILPAYLLALGFGPFAVGLVSTATLLGSAVLAIAVGRWSHRHDLGLLLRWSALLMAATGFCFAGLSDFWPLLLVAFLGTINPNAGDVSVFLPLEHARLSGAAKGDARTALFARYTLLGGLLAALGALAVGLPDALAPHGWVPLDVMRLMFVGYGGIGLLVWLLYRRLPAGPEGAAAPAGLTQSRGTVLRLAALFSIDAFAGGLLVNALLALWLFERHGLSLAEAGTIFFWLGLLGALSQLAAPWLARRIGLLNTMVFTHIPANLCLIAASFMPDLGAALALLSLRAALSQMDVPARAAYVMAVVTPPERAAAAAFTAVPRSLAAALGPTLGGWAMAAGYLAAPLLFCGGLKLLYDILLWRQFRRVAQDGRD